MQGMQRDDSLEKLVCLSGTKEVDTYSVMDLYNTPFQIVVGHLTFCVIYKTEVVCI